MAEDDNIREEESIKNEQEVKNSETTFFFLARTNYAWLAASIGGLILLGLLATVWFKATPDKSIQSFYKKMDENKLDNTLLQKYCHPTNDQFGFRKWV